MLKHKMQDKFVANESKELSATWTEQLKSEVLAFHRRTGMKLTTIGAKSLGNARMWARLARGGTITLEKADELRAWMAGPGANIKPKGEDHAEGN